MFRLFRFAWGHDRSWMWRGRGSRVARAVRSRSRGLRPTPRVENLEGRQLLSAGVHPSALQVHALRTEALIDRRLAHAANDASANTTITAAQATTIPAGVP